MLVDTGELLSKCHFNLFVNRTSSVITNSWGLWTPKIIHFLENNHLNDCSDIWIPPFITAEEIIHTKTQHSPLPSHYKDSNYKVQHVRFSLGAAREKMYYYW